ncbi:preprotein translocase subunit SecF [Microbacteriaceae bacterium SG_E_30_P1]|uniref:Protein-export membrane protein SecF n=1 Tax=Antiquaquibacter oligotrophicus TaxID=2880260 RepID=A0ABT6KPI1_9MICO|nr:protein translocase subunit SecF [Antiquaquibacter oligotrophicus]MDH6181002.1 preprotein translocase subunit SecF [Antiquaquibacter oligotrophicus]UDF13298.1 protein translocase subunit SecF [Antiquaquibacter oligotrophicus]
MASFSQFGNDLYTGKRSFDFVGKKRIWFTAAIIMLIIAVGGTVLRGGFVLGIEFTGGSEFTISNPADVDQTLAQDAVAEIVPGSTSRVSVVNGGDSIRVQTDQVSTEESQEIRDALSAAYDVSEDQVTYSFIGATWGADITRSALTALGVFLLFAAATMALYFRTWKMSAAAIIALIHDLIFTAGVYGIVGFEVTPAAVIGFLTILGYSLYDTVVVFDKIRENTAEGSSRTFGESVNLAVNQTLVRSINTSVVALLPVASILFIGSVLLGAGTLRDIALSLFIGIFVGTYSTIFIAAPLYAWMRQGETIVRKNDERKASSARMSGAVR